MNDEWKLICWNWSQWWKISFDMVKFMTWEFSEVHHHKMRTKLLELYFKYFYFCFKNVVFQAEVDVLLCSCTKLCENAWSDNFCLIVYILDNLTEIPMGPFLQPGPSGMHPIFQVFIIYGLLSSFKFPMADFCVVLNKLKSMTESRAKEIRKTFATSDPEHTNVIGYDTFR